MPLGSGSWWGGLQVGDSYFRVTIDPLKMLILGTRSRFAVGRPSPKSRKPKLALCLAGASGTSGDGTPGWCGPALPSSSPPSTHLQRKPLNRGPGKGSLLPMSPSEKDGLQSSQIICVSKVFLAPTLLNYLRRG